MSLNKIYNAESLDKQFNDLFRVGIYGKNQLMRNPHNIKWTLENFCTDKELVNLYQEYIEDCIVGKKAFLTDNKKINELIDKEEVIVSRMQYLVNKGFDISKKCNFVIKRNSFEIVKNAIELGLDLNYKTKEGNTILRLALMRSPESIQNLIFAHPNTDISVRDMNGVSYGVLALLHDNFNIAQEIMKRDPEQFMEIYYTENRASFKDKNILHLINEKTKLSKKNKIKYDNILQEIIDYIIEKKPELLNQIDGKKETPENQYFLDGMFKLALNKKLEKSLSFKDNNVRKLKL